MLVLPCAALSMTLGEQPTLSRRGVACACSSALLLAVLPARTSAAVPDRLSSGLERLEVLLAQWKDVTIDCQYADVPRELLETKNKEKLLKQATQNALFDKSASINVCRSTDRAVRQALGTTATGPLSRLDKYLMTPDFLDSIPEDRLDDAVALSERLQKALSGADAAAFMSETGDYSARTPFKEGEAPTAPNLDAAKDMVSEARDLLRSLIALTGA